MLAFSSFIAVRTVRINSLCSIAMLTWMGADKLYKATRITSLYLMCKASREVNLEEHRRWQKQVQGQTKEFFSASLSVMLFLCDFFWLMIAFLEMDVVSWLYSCQNVSKIIFKYELLTKAHKYNELHNYLLIIRLQQQIFLAPSKQYRWSKDFFSITWNWKWSQIQVWTQMHTSKTDHWVKI